MSRSRSIACRSYLSIACALSISWLFIGCGKRTSEQSSVGLSKQAPKADGFFKTSYKDETQFIVHETIRQLVGMAIFGATGSAPATDQVGVSLVERSDSTFRHPVYDVAVRIGGRESKFVLKVDDVWARQTYTSAFTNIAGLAEWHPVKREPKTEGAPKGFAELLDGKDTSLEKQSRIVSELLGRDFAAPELHERASWILGVLALKENSGMFSDVRTELCQLAAHLTVAEFLSPAGLSLTGRMAELAGLSCASNEAEVVKRIEMLPSAGPPIAAFAGIIRAHATRDYRALGSRTNLVGMEKIAWFRARAIAVSMDTAWEGLTPKDIKMLPDYCRMANADGSSVEVGHQVLQQGLKGELQDLVDVYREYFGSTDKNPPVVESLNSPQTGMFGTNGTVRVISWGTWAMYFQRHIGNSLVGGFDFLNRMLGAPEEAKAFSDKTTRLFGKMTLFPFVLRQFAVDGTNYHLAVDSGFSVVVAHPELVSPDNWNWLCRDGPGNESYEPFSDPHLGEWHKHNPPPGTAIDIVPRAEHPSLGKRPDLVAIVEELHLMAPYDNPIANFLCDRKYSGSATFDQAKALYGPLLEYSAHALMRVSKYAIAQPEEYERLISKAAELDPARYFLLSDYFRDRGDKGKQIKFAVQGHQLTKDRVRAASYARILIDHHLDTGDKKQAKKVADEAGEVYSALGLEAKAWYHERVGELFESLKWLENLEERYGKTSPLLSFCSRYVGKTQSPRLEGRLKAVLERYRPPALEKVSLSDLVGPPKDGAIFAASSPELLKAGLKRGDVVVAIYGARIHGFPEYARLRDINPKTTLEIIVWDGNGYREVVASLPDKKFGVDMPTYSSK